MKKKVIAFIALMILAIIFLSGCTNKEQEEKNAQEGANKSSNVVAQRTQAEANLQEQQNAVIEKRQEEEKNKETPIASYATKIKDNSAGRLENIRITCKAISGKVIEPGQRFSFNEIVGEPTTAKGYKEASVIIDHKTEKGIGGGNCQVSSTIYNAVLNVPTLVVTERHEHGKDVTYVPDGKDAAVSYGSLDLKFRNDTGKRIRIDVTTDDSNISVAIVQIGI